MPNKQQGQTLIETIVAMFILVMGIVASFGLATYALSATSGITNQLVGMGLAREGIEVIKNMRDTNWLNDTLATVVVNTDGSVTGGCFDFQNTTQPSGLCYKNWLGTTTAPGIYGIDPGTTSANYRLLYDGAGNFSLAKETNNTADTFKIYRYVSGSGKKTFYTQDNTTNTSSTQFYRRVVLTKESRGPYAFTSPGPALKVTVDVWWSQKNCPAVAVPDSLPLGCRITLETYLTNWKTY